MGKRTDLQTIFEEILGTRNVYFQPPETIKMEYPCIVYHMDSGDTQFANNIPYIFNRRYNVLLIAEDPDNPYIEKIAELPMCTFDRFYTVDNLNHYSYNLYF